jgi:hypothetical protein
MGYWGIINDEQLGLRRKDVPRGTLGMHFCHRMGDKVFHVEHPGCRFPVNGEILLKEGRTTNIMIV